MRERPDYLGKPLPIRAKAQLVITWDALKPPWWIEPLFELLDRTGTAGEARTGRIVPGQLGARVRVTDQAANEGETS